MPGSRPGNLFLPESQRYSLLFSSRSSVVLAFTFRFKINCELILVYGLCQIGIYDYGGQDEFFFSMRYSAVPASFVEKTPFPSSCLGAFVKNQLFKYPSLSGPICLPLPSTILSWLLQIHSKSSKKEGQVLQPCCYFKRLLWWFQTLCLCVTILEPARLFL